MIEMLEPWIHLIHILGAIIWVGGGVMLSLLGARTRKSEDPPLIGNFAQNLSYVG
jgi:putative copper export protein